MLKNEHVRSMNFNWQCVVESNQEVRTANVFNDYIFSNLGEYMSMCMLEKHVYVADLVTV